jgi:hypothetical protein
MFGLGVWACSQGDPQPKPIPDPPKKDASTSGNDSGGGDGGSDAPVTCPSEDGGCSTLQNCGSRIYIVDVNQNPPQPQGGASVPDGKYVLTDYRDFTGTTGKNGQTTSWFTQTMTLATEATDAGSPDGASIQQMHWEQVSASNLDPSQFSSTGTAQFSGTNLSIAIDCPGSTSPFLSTFSVTGAQLVLLVGSSDGTAQLTYTKQ